MFKRFQSISWSECEGLMKINQPRQSLAERTDTQNADIEILAGTFYLYILS